MHTQNRYQGGYLEKDSSIHPWNSRIDAEVFKTKIKDIEIQEDGNLLFRFLDGHTEGVDLL